MLIVIKEEIKNGHAIRNYYIAIETGLKWADYWSGLQDAASFW